MSSTIPDPVPHGIIRVGTRLYGRNGTTTNPSYEGFRPILCLTQSSPYGSLGPYCLKNDNSHIFENTWQFSKIYKHVPASKQLYSRYDKTVIWDHPAETHMLNGQITEEYWCWRQRGLDAEHAIRYPVGRAHRNKCLYSFKSRDDPTPLDYIQARKEIYLPGYQELVVQEPKYTKLQTMLAKGQNLLIIEVDGPHQESMEYYKEKYGVADDFIENDTILVTPENMDIMLNDPKHAFGHGYCLGMSLLQM
ncbi:MAG: hypothetical protein JKX76_02045 [Colwellia sp.]|nr:hypothetical protein [Colwellia sp.]